MNRKSENLGVLGRKTCSQWKYSQSMQDYSRFSRVQNRLIFVKLQRINMLIYLQSWNSFLAICPWWKVIEIIHRQYLISLFFFNSHPKKSGFNPWFNAQTGSGNIYSQWARGDSYRASIVLKIGRRSLSRRKLLNDTRLIKSISEIAPPSTPYSRYGSFMVFTVTCLFSGCEIFGSTRFDLS